MQRPVARPTSHVQSSSLASPACTLPLRSHESRLRKMHALVAWASTPHSAMKQAQFVGGPLQLFTELRCRNADQHASQVSGTPPDQHGLPILGELVVDVLPCIDLHRPRLYRGLD